MSGAPAWRELTQLLHDARLRHLAWNPSLAEASLQFDCLRRDLDGSALSKPVEFRLGGVKAIVVGYDRSTARPSSYEPSHLLSENDIRHWSFGPQLVFVMMNGPGWVGDIANALHVDWFLGGREALCASPFQLGVSFGLYLENMTMLWGCEEFAVYSAGVPLSLETWQSQFSAWWNHWEEHWRVTGGKGRTAEDTVIPMAVAPEPDLSYQPPLEPAVDWEPTDAPAEILLPITDWFQAYHQRDWPRLARSWPHRNYSAEERAVILAKEFERRFGCWGYGRQVDEWWIDRSRGQVKVRGVEHHKTLGPEYPTENLESVWSFYLQKLAEGWVIRNFSQGWPPYKSALAKSDADKPWLQKWKTGKVLTQRKKEDLGVIPFPLIILMVCILILIYWLIKR
jgi:hypothetical protein